MSTTRQNNRLSEPISLTLSFRSLTPWSGPPFLFSMYPRHRTRAIPSTQHQFCHNRCWRETTRPSQHDGPRVTWETKLDTSRVEKEQLFAPIYFSPWCRVPKSFNRCVIHPQQINRADCDCSTPCPSLLEATFINFNSNLFYIFVCLFVDIACKMSFQAAEKRGRYHFY